MSTVKVDVDEDFALYVRTISEIEELRERVRATQRRMLTNAGWEVHAPGSPVWLEETIASGQYKILTTEFLRERHKDHEVWVDPESKRRIVHWPTAWGLHWRRVQKSCALIVTGIRKKATP
jgi:hypothetical protein